MVATITCPWRSIPSPLRDADTAGDFHTAPVFYRTYSRKTSTGRESWSEVGTRNLEGLRRLGKLSDADVALMQRMQTEKKALPSGQVALDWRHPLD